MYDFEEANITDIPVVVLDTETTGLQPFLGDRIIEIGAVRYENWRPVAQMSQLVNPQRPVPPKASSITQIYDEDLTYAPTFAAVASELRALLEGALVVAHSAKFDARFIGMEFATMAIQQNDVPLHTDPILPNPWLCTLRLAQKYFHFGRNNLENIARRLGVHQGRAHRALQDALMTAQICKHFVTELGKSHVHTVGDLLYAQGKTTFTPPYPQITLPPRLQTALHTQTPVSLVYGNGNGSAETAVVTPSYYTIKNNIPYLIGIHPTENIPHYIDVRMIYDIAPL